MQLKITNYLSVPIFAKISLFKTINYSEAMGEYASIENVAAISFFFELPEKDGSEKARIEIPPEKTYNAEIDCKIANEDIPVILVFNFNELEGKVDFSAIEDKTKKEFTLEILEPDTGRN